MQLLRFVFFMLFAFHSESAFEVTENYPRSLELNNDDQYIVYWKVSGLTQNDEITFEIHAKTLGWIGLGFSSNGGMPGSDVVMGGWDDQSAQPYLYVKLIKRQKLGL